MLFRSWRYDVIPKPFAVIFALTAGARRRRRTAAITRADVGRSGHQTTSTQTLVPQIRSVFLVTTMLPLMHCTSVTISNSLHGPAHELVDELELLTELPDTLDELTEDELTDERLTDDELLPLMELEVALDC